MLNSLLRKFLLNKDEKKFISSMDLCKGNKNCSSVVLLDIMDIPSHIYQNYVISEILKKNDFSVAAVIFNDFTIHSKISPFIFDYTRIGRLYKNILNHPPLIYSNIKNNNKVNKKTNEIFNALTSVEEILNIKVSDFIIGDLIYDTILRRENMDTITKIDDVVKTYIRIAVEAYYSIEEYFLKYNVSQVILSHSVYIQYGILARMAIGKGIRTLVIPMSGLYFCKELSVTDYRQTKSHMKYPNIFSKLQEQDKRRKLAAKCIGERLLGIKDASVSYMLKSAYSGKEIGDGLVRNDKENLLIMLHCFFDSPHIYNSMVFRDFREWIEITLSNIDYDRYNVVVKPHPNGVKANDYIIVHLKSKYCKAHFLDKDVSNKELLREKFTAVFTVYGTVAHEFAYKGYKVITCGDNPHSAYDFTYECKSIDEYIYVIKNLDDITTNPSKEKIEEFFYMHYLYDEHELCMCKDPFNHFEAGISRDSENTPIYEKYIKSHNNIDINFISLSVLGTICND